MKILALVGILIALLFASFNFFSFDNISRIKGVVAAISADSITLDAAEDTRSRITIEVSRSTLFLQDGEFASWRNLKVGTQVDVDALTNANGLYAINISFEKQPFHGNTGSLSVAAGTKL
jgi:Domain of unknown function (DUF5666)